MIPNHPLGNKEEVKREIKRIYENGFLSWRSEHWLWPKDAEEVVRECLPYGYNDFTYEALNQLSCWPETESCMVQLGRTYSPCMWVQLAQPISHLALYGLRSLMGADSAVVDPDDPTLLYLWWD